MGVIGAGSFGTTIANLLSFNGDVMLYSRQASLVKQINEEHHHFNLQLKDSLKATNDLESIAEQCDLLFTIVPSNAFRQMTKSLAPFLRPYHILIHGTKGFDLTDVDENNFTEAQFTRDQVHTMSEVILQESSVVRIGCLSGPNLSTEIMEGQPTATVIGSKFNEVIKVGRDALDSQQFHVFGTHDILGAELAGAMKNAFAIGSGILGGLGMGKNIQAMLITRGLMEMIYMGKAMGANSSAFVGTAGIGDLVATATSKDSRNYSFGVRLANGESMKEISTTMPELAEGVRTIAIMHQLAKGYKLHVPITQMLYNVVFEEFDIKRAINYLMKYPYSVDVDFL